MGWFSNVCSAVGSFVKSATSAVVSGAKKAWEKTKEIAGKAVSWMADKAERFVGAVKNVWEKIKPILQKARTFLQIAAKVAPWPWLRTVASVMDKAVEYLEKFDKSGLAKKLDAAIKWVIDVSRNIKDKLLTPGEIVEAEQRKQVFEEAVYAVPETERKAIDLAALLNDYVMVQTAIANLLGDGSIKDFEHYLRLRATQKLLKSAETTLMSANNLDDITEDDIFLLHASANLLADTPTLSDADAVRLDSVIFARHGKKLIPFVFEEMIMAWGQNLQQLEEEWQVSNNRLAKDEVIKRRLEITKRVSGVEPEEEKMLAELNVTVPKGKVALDQLGKRTREMRNYVYAAEGFLQTLEKSGEELEDEGKEFLADEGSRVGMIIIDCAQNGKAWEELVEDEQSLIIDFANIFEEASRERAGKLIEIEVAA